MEKIERNFYGAIPVIYKSRVVNMLPITHAPIKEFDMIKFLLGEDKTERVVKYETIRNLPLIEIDRSFLNVTFEYYLDGEVIDTTHFELYTGANILDEIDPLEDAYLRACEYVTNAVDTYGPTTVEKEHHYEMTTVSATDTRAKEYLLSFIGKTLHQLPYISEEYQPKYKYQIWSQLYGMGILQPLDDDPDVGEILVNANHPRGAEPFRCDVYYIKNQKKYLYEKTFKSEKDLKAVCSRVLAFEHKSINEVENSRIEATSPRGDRINLIVPQASDNYLLNIRKFSNFSPDLNSMYTSGTINSAIDNLMKVIVQGKANIGIGGEMGTGKTTLINFLLTYTPKMERKIIIASVSEMDTERVLKGHDVAVLKVDDKTGATFASLLVTSLRTTANRVIIPESRGGEFKSLYEANLKTKGNMFTAHALDPHGFMNVCVDMYMSSPDAGNESSEYIKNKLVRGIDIIIIMAKIGNKIRVNSISEVIANENGGFDKISDLYVWEHDRENPMEGGRYAATGNIMSQALMTNLNRAGVPHSVLEETNQALLKEYQENNTN